MHDSNSQWNESAHYLLKMSTSPAIEPHFCVGHGFGVPSLQ